MDCLTHEYIFFDGSKCCKKCGDFKDEIYYADDECELMLQSQLKKYRKQKYNRKTHMKSLLLNNPNKDLVMNKFLEYEKRFDKIKKYYLRNSIISYKYLIYRILTDNGIECNKPKINKYKIKEYKSIYRLIKR